ncbi:MAG: Ig-like domain-containing protein [Planctomycetota bacterium]|jgi:hypothetical protein
MLRIVDVPALACIVLLPALIGCQPAVVSTESLEVDPDTITFDEPSGSQTIEVFRVSSAGTRTMIDLPSSELMLTSSNPDAVTVSEDGTVTAEATGQSTITVEAAFGSDSVSVTVGAAKDIALSLRTSPADGESGVAVTRETILAFDRTLVVDSIAESSVRAVADGAALDARTHFDASGQRITLFYRENLPGDAEVTVTVDGDQIPTTAGDMFDADGDGHPGGTREFTFRTASLTPVPGTLACGRVFASEFSGEGINVPLSNVTVTVDGAEAQIRAATGDDGRFCLEDAPAGQVFVHIDGRTHEDGPDGTFYPFVGKMWNLYGGERNEVGIIHLPAIAEQSLTTVSATSDTTISFAGEQLVMVDDPELLPALFNVRLTVPADSLFADDGTRGGQVGIAPVAPDRLPGNLPPGLNLPLVITVQTSGPTNFDEPVAACFPNLPDPGTGRVLESGDKSALWSFNHDKGLFEVVGPMTVSNDGTRVCTDEGVGIPAPGWHSSSDGSEGTTFTPPPLPPAEPECPSIDPDIIQISNTAASCLSALGDFGEFIEAIETITSEVQNLSDLSTQFTEAFESYGAGETDAAEVQLLIAQIDAAKSIISQVADAAATAEGPISKAISLLGCAQSLLEAAEDPCMTVMAAPARCVSNRQFVRRACDDRDRVLEAVQFVKMLMEAVNEQIDDVAMTALCRAIDVAEATFLSEGLKARVASQAINENFLDALADVEAELSPIVIVSEEESNALETWLSELALITDNAADLYIQTEGPVANAFVRLEYARAVQRIRAEASGFYRAVLPAETFFKLSIYDPSGDRCGSNLGESAAIGEPTLFHSPAMGACGDADDDGDGLSNEAEEIIGTSSDDPDTDGDGIDDLTEVQNGTDPGGGSLLRLGEVVEGDLAVPGEMDVWLVAVEAGDVLFLDVLDIAVTGGIDLSFNWFAPNGEEIAFSAPRLGDIDRGDRRIEFEEAGVYTLSISAVGDNADGSYRMRVVQPTVENDEITLDVPFSGELTIGGDIDEWTFHGEAGTSLLFEGLELLSGEDVLAFVQMDAPSGELVLIAVGGAVDLLRFGPFTLQETGTYTLRVGEGFSDDTYSYTFVLREDFVGDAMAITLDESQSGLVLDEGGFDEWTLELSAEDRLYLDMESVDGGPDAVLDYRLLAPDGEFELGGRSSVAFVDEGDKGPFVLPLPGTYQLFFRASEAGISYSFRISTPEIDSAPVTPGAETAGAIEEPGEIDEWTFDAATGQQVSFDLLDVVGNDLVLIDVTLLAPDGSEVTDSVTITPQDNADFGPVTLDQDGTYRLRIESSFGNASLISYTFVVDAL